MNLQEFNLMPLSQRAASIWQWGTFLDTRIEGSYGLVLYHMGRFFCEMWYELPLNEIVLVQAFTSHTLPEHYLETVELPRF